MASAQSIPTPDAHWRCELGTEHGHRTPLFVVMRVLSRVASASACWAIAYAWVSAASVVTPDPEIVGQMIVLGTGMGLTSAPATESIMGAVSTAKAGVGSAVNDTTCELGGTLGVAVIGSSAAGVPVADKKAPRPRGP